MIIEVGGSRSSDDSRQPSSRPMYIPPRTSRGAGDRVVRAFATGGAQAMEAARRSINALETEMRAQRGAGNAQAIPFLYAGAGHFDVQPAEMGFLERTTNQTITQTTWTVLSAYVTAVDNGLQVDDVNGRVYLGGTPAGSWFLAVAQAQFAANATGYRRLGIYSQPSAVLVRGDDTQPTNVAAVVTSLTAISIFQAGADSYVEAQVYHNAGGDLVVNNCGLMVTRFK